MPVGKSMEFQSHFWSQIAVAAMVCLAWNHILVAPHGTFAGLRRGAEEGEAWGRSESWAQRLLGPLFGPLHDPSLVRHVRVDCDLGALSGPTGPTSSRASSMTGRSTSMLLSNDVASALWRMRLAPPAQRWRTSPRFRPALNKTLPPSPTSSLRVHCPCSP